MNWLVQMWTPKVMQQLTISYWHFNNQKWEQLQLLMKMKCIQMDRFSNSSINKVINSNEIIKQKKMEQTLLQKYKNMKINGYVWFQSALNWKSSDSSFFDCRISLLKICSTVDWFIEYSKIANSFLLSFMKLNIYPKLTFVYSFRQAKD